MHDGLVAALRQTQRLTVTEAAVLPLRQRGSQDRLVAVDATGEPIRPDRYSDLFAMHSKDAGLPPIRLHDLRHSALSALLAQGVPVHVVAKIAGHDPSVTLRTYAHAQDAAMQDAVDRLGALYGTR
jgi:integrase